MNSLGRIKGNQDFKKVYNCGKSFADKYLVIYCMLTGQENSRFGFSVGKKVGKAVVRNRYKRVLREIVRKNEQKIKSGFDCVVIIRPKSIEADYWKLENSFLRLLKRADLALK